MTKEQAIEESIAIWTHVVETGEKPAYAYYYRFKCPLCDLYNNPHIWDTDRGFYMWKAKLCLDCPLYDRIGKSSVCCYEYEQWARASSYEDKRIHAQALLDKLRGLLNDKRTSD